jgi:hypothetical protein
MEVCGEEPQGGSISGVKRAKKSKNKKGKKDKKGQKKKKNRQEGVTVSSMTVN